MIGERPRTHNTAAVLPNKTDVSIFQAPRLELSQDNSVEIGGFLFPKKHGLQTWARLEISTAVNRNPTSVDRVIAGLEQVGTIQPVQLKLGNRRKANFYNQSDVELILPFLRTIKPRTRQSKYGDSDPIGKVDEGIGIETKEIRGKTSAKKELPILKDRVLKLAVIDMLDEVIDSRTNVSYNIRIRLGEHLPSGITIYDIFGKASHQNLNDVFIEALESAFGKNQNSNKNGDRDEESNPSPIDFEIQERVKIINQKKLKADELITHAKRMFALNVYQGKEKE